MKIRFIYLLAILLFIAPLPSIADESNQAFTIALGKGITLHLTATQFDAQKHKITKCPDTEEAGICLIDGKPIFGTDLDLPRNQLVKASIRIGRDVVSLDISCMYNPWFDKPNSNNFTVKKGYGGHFISGHFSDGAGSYDAEWFVIQNSSVRTRLVKGEC